MTRFKKELIKRNVMLEETLPYLPYGEIEAIIVHSDILTVSYYDNRVGWYYHEYNRNMQLEYCWDADDIDEEGTINKRKKVIL